MEDWFFLRSPAADAATNMAVDESLLLGAEQRGRPLLRVYSWLRPAVSIGYFQPYPEHLAGTHEIVRRPTGGGLVYHGNDTTYTVVVPRLHRLLAMSVAEGYCLIHKAVADALGESSAMFDQPTPSVRGSYQCFESPVQGDVVAEGQKLAGGAQRRTRWGMLHQGSIAKQISAHDIKRGFTKQLSARFVRYDLSKAEAELADKLAREKYGTAAWNQRQGHAKFAAR